MSDEYEIGYWVLYDEGQEAMTWSPIAAGIQKALSLETALAFQQDMEYVWGFCARVHKVQYKKAP